MAHSGISVDEPVLAPSENRPYLGLLSVFVVLLYVVLYVVLYVGRRFSESSRKPVREHAEQDPWRDQANWQSGRPMSVCDQPSTDKQKCHSENEPEYGAKVCMGYIGTHQLANHALFGLLHLYLVVLFSLCHQYDTVC